MVAPTGIETTLFFTDNVELHGRYVRLEQFSGHVLVGRIWRTPEDANTTGPVPEALTYHLQPDHRADTGTTPTQVIYERDVKSVEVLDIPGPR